MTSPSAPAGSKPKIWLIVAVVGTSLLGIAVIMFVMFGPEALKAARETREAVQALETKQTKLRISNDIRALTIACGAFRTQHAGEWPPNLPTLLKRDDMGNGPYVLRGEALFDPWGREYEYDSTGPNNRGTQPDIFCELPDGKVIGNWGRSAER